MFGPELYRSRVLELNASDDRGIQVVRDKVKKFAQVAVIKSANHAVPSFKIIILDEADSLTGEAQSALRRIIEKYTKVTRFCLICNYVSKIIDPLASRCAKFRFKAVAFDSQVHRLRYICGQEQLNCTDEAISSLIRLSEGDLRRSITLLQSAAKLFGQTISHEMVQEVAGIIPADVVDAVYNVLRGMFEEVQEMCKSLILNGYQPDSLIEQLADCLMDRPELTDFKKARIGEVIAEADYSLISGGLEDLVMLKMLTQLRLIMIS